MPKRPTPNQSLREKTHVRRFMEDSERYELSFRAMVLAVRKVCTPEQQREIEAIAMFAEFGGPDA